MGMTGGLASHLFAYLIGFGVSSFLSTFYASKPEFATMEFDIMGPTFFAKNKILVVAFCIILFNQVFAII
jgi:hypothetical protein